VILGFDHVGTVVLGYGLTAGVVALYTARLVLRGRQLARRLPPQDRPWTT
jgi:ABC-type uncharacterized transport system permease subunit